MDTSSFLYASKLFTVLVNYNLDSSGQLSWKILSPIFSQSSDHQPRVLQSSEMSDTSKTQTLLVYKTRRKRLNNSCHLAFSKDFGSLFSCFCLVCPAADPLPWPVQTYACLPPGWAVLSLSGICFLDKSRESKCWFIALSLTWRLGHWHPRSPSVHVSHGSVFYSVTIQI